MRDKIRKALDHFMGEVINKYGTPDDDRLGYVLEMADSDLEDAVRNLENVLIEALNKE